MSLSSHICILHVFVCVCIVQLSCSVVCDSATPWTAAHQASLSITNSRSLLKLMSMESQYIHGVHGYTHVHGISFLSPWSRWCHPTISSSVVPFSSRLESLQESESFQMRQLSASGGQSIAVSASTLAFPMNIQDWFPIGWIGWISLQSKELWRSSPTPHFKGINSFVLSFLYSPTLTSIHDYWKNQSFDEMDFCM